MLVYLEGWMVHVYVWWCGGEGGGGVKILCIAQCPVTALGALGTLQCQFPVPHALCIAHHRNHGPTWAWGRLRFDVAPVSIPKTPIGRMLRRHCASPAGQLGELKGLLGDQARERFSPLFQISSCLSCSWLVHRLSDRDRLVGSRPTILCPQ